MKQGLAEERLFVKKVICGKGYLLKKIEFKGRGRMGMIKKPKCKIQVVLEEKPLEEYYRMIIRGDAPEGAVYQLKTILLQSQANLRTVHNMSSILTSRGRYYRRTQFKRLVKQVLREYRMKGQATSKEKIERNLLD